MSSELDTLMRLLQSERRRIVIELLEDLQDKQDSDEVTIPVEDLSRQVAVIEAGVDSNTVGHTVQRSSKVELWHSHLPLLDDYGIIEFNVDAETVATTDRTQQVARTMWKLIEVIEESELELARLTESSS